jgi:hypothetical protein
LQRRFAVRFRLRCLTMKAHLKVHIVSCPSGFARSRSLLSGASARLGQRVGALLLVEEGA